MSKIQTNILIVAFLLTPVFLYGGKALVPKETAVQSPNPPALEMPEGEQENLDIEVEDEGESISIPLKPNAAQGLFLSPQSNIALSDTITVSWNVPVVPEGAGIVIWLERAVPAEESFQHRGATGPITLEILDAPAQGQVQWEVGQVGCAPTDYPTWCETQPGRYHLSAVVYDRSDFSILGWPDPQMEAAQELMRLKSEAFNIQGDFDLKPVSLELYGQVMRKVASVLSVDDGYGISRLQDFVFTVGDLVKGREGMYCQTYQLTAPFFGEINACGQASQRGQVTTEIVKPIALGYGIQTYQEAKAQAQTAAEAPYLDRVAFASQPTPEQAGYPGSGTIDFYEWSNANPHATTYLTSTLRDWHFKEDQWLFLLEVNMAGGSVSQAERFNDYVLVLVPSPESACIIEQSATRGVSVDYETTNLSCP